MRNDVFDDRSTSGESHNPDTSPAGVARALQELLPRVAGYVVEVASLVERSERRVEKRVSYRDVLSLQIVSGDLQHAIRTLDAIQEGE